MSDPNKTKKAKKKMRLYSLDILRGISMFLMMLAHVMTYWPEENALWVISIYFIILNIMGTSQFTYVAGLGLSFSWLQYRAKGMSEKEIIQKSMSRTYVMIFVSFIYNFIAVIARGTGIAGLWSWNILQCIAFCRLMGTFFMKIQRKYRFIFAIFSIFLTGLTTWWMLPLYETNIFANLVYYIFYNPLHGDGFLVFFPFFLIGTVLGEIIFEIVQIQSKNPTDDNQEIKTLLKYWLKIGIVLFFTGILIGLIPMGPKYDYFGLIRWLNTHPNIMISTLPFFLMPNTFPWSLYCTRLHIILTVLFVYFIDVLKKSHKPFSIFIYFGRYSLTIYFVHYLFLILPFAFFPNLALDYIWIQIAFLSFEFFVWGFAYALDRKWHMKVSFEYLILYWSNMIYEVMLKPKKGKEK
jgi:Acyltransferase family